MIENIQLGEEDKFYLLFRLLKICGLLKLNMKYMEHRLLEEHFFSLDIIIFNI